MTSIRMNPGHRKKPILKSTGQWVVQNLFSSWGNTLLTLAGISFLIWALPPVFRWAVLDATWLGDARAACDAADPSRTGACWVFIKVRMNLFIYGFYPGPEQWRINFSFMLLSAAVIPLLFSSFFNNRNMLSGVFLGAGAVMFYLWGMGAGVFTLMFLFLPFGLSRISLKPFLFRPSSVIWISLGAALISALAIAWVVHTVMGLANGEAGAFLAAVTAGFISFPLMVFKPLPVRTWQWILILTLFPLFAYFMFIGGVFGLAFVETHFWGGLFLTLVIACSGMVTALPIGVLLALGRRSEMPAIKIICLSFIELVRGVPLVSVLFMASVMFPLFLPEGAHFDKLLRALIGVSFFYAAYIAEVIRGGLQAIPKGQYEAAKALGWGYWKMMGLIIIPQTLRLVIPGLANNILSLFKDTTLVAVIGLLDLLGIAKAAMADVEWLGFTKEAYLFAGLVFWILCFSISRYCSHLERKYHSSYH